MPERVHKNHGIKAVAQIKRCVAVAMLFLLSVAPAGADVFDAEQGFRAAMVAFREKNFYSARLLLQEIVLKDGRGEYGDDAQYYLAMTYYYERDYRTAQFEFKALQRDFPDSPFVVRSAFWNGEAWFQRRKFREALESHAHFVRKYRENILCASALYTIGYIYNEQKRYDEAIQEFGRALRDYPESTAVAALTLQMGIAQYNGQNYADARRTFENLLVKHTDADNLDAARFWLGKSYYAEEKFQDAYREFTAVHSGFATSTFAAEALYLAALCQYRTGNTGDALALLQKVIAEYPKSPMYGFARLRQAQLLSEKNEIAQALPPLIDIINNQRNHEVFAPALELYAELRIKQGKTNEALATLEALVNEESVKGNVRKEVLRRQADLLFREGRYSEAANRYEALATEFATGREGATHYLLLARARLREGKHQAALGALAEVEKHHDDAATQADSLFLKAEISYQLGKFTQALQLYARFTRKYPRHERVLDADLGIGWTYFELKQYARAADHFRRILKNHQDQAARSKALVALGACQYNLRDLAGAEHSYKEVMAKYAGEQATFNEAVYQLAWLDFRRNRPTEASAGFKRYVALQGEIPRRNEAAYFAALSDFQLSRFAEARDQLAALIVVPQLPGWLREKALADLAKAQAALGEAENARTTWRKLLQDYPESAIRDEARYQEIVLSLKLRDEPSALAALENLRSGSATSTWYGEALSEMAVYYRTQRNYAAATKVLTELGAQRTKPDEKLEVTLRRAQILLDQGSIAEARSLLETIMYNEDAGNDIITRAAGMNFQVYENERSFADGAAAADRLAARFAENEPLRDEMRLSAARFRFLSKDYAGSREMLLPLSKNRAIAPRARYLLGEIALAVNDQERALDYFRQITQKQDAALWLKARLVIGEILFSRKQFEEAAREFSRIAYAENRDDVTYEKALYRAALAFKAIGRTREFETFRARLAEAFPQSPYNKELE